VLQQVPRPSEYVTASGRIDMAHVMREAHRRVKAELRTWRPSIFASEPPKYAELFREKLKSELYTAQIERRRHVEPARNAVPLTDTFQYSPIFARAVRYAGGISQG
jgi:hypothetical protein